MEGDSPRPGNTPTGAVFLSYASQDTEAAQRICEALRAAGIEVWFDKSELRGGEAWDRHITRQIRECALFLAVISAHTEERSEGYFRREWRIAVERMRDMADDRSFLLPVAIDSTREDTGRVPDRFREFQWLRLPSGETSPAAVERIRRLLSPAGSIKPVRPGTTADSGGSAVRDAPVADGRKKPGWLLPALLVVGFLVIAGGYLAVNQLVLSKHLVPAPAAISDKSIAVLPFTDLSEKKDQGYFSDGLSEELIDLLAKVPDLRVAARTSSFYFKDKTEDIPSIAKRLLVANVLEGSVRKAGSRLRVTAQLVRADNGYHLWSETYDRTFDDVFKLQDDIASAVVTALKAKLMAAPSAQGRQSANTEAYTQYLLGRQILLQNNWAEDSRAVSAFRRAIALDPSYALAWAGLGEALDWSSEEAKTPAEFAAGKREAIEATNKAVALRPDLPEALAARGRMRASLGRDFAGAESDFKRALALDPDNVEARARYAYDVLLPTGREEEARAAFVNLTKADPLNPTAWRYLGYAEVYFGHLAAGQEAFERSLEISPEQTNTAAAVADCLLLQGRPQEALDYAARSRNQVFRLTPAAMAYHALGREEDSRRALDELIAKEHDGAAYQIAEVFAWRGETERSFEWLERAYAQHDGGLTFLRVDPFLTRLHGNPRYNTLLRKLNLPPLDSTK